MNRISHGFLGKFKTYEIPVPQVKELTLEEREKALREKIKPWVFEPEKLVRIGGYVPTTTPPPPVETFYLETAEGDALQTAQGDNILWYIEPAPIDPDAQAFFDAITTAGGSLTSTEETAVNDLVVDLKGYGLWNTFDAFYPYVGGTSTSTKFNLLDPQDTNGAFRITWSGLVSFSSLGVKANNNGGGNTYLNPQTLGYTAMTMGTYINQGFAEAINGDYDMGGYDGVDDFMITLGFTNNITKYVNYNTNQYKTTNSGVYDRGLLLGQNDGTITQLYQDNTQLISTAQTFGSCNMTIGIGCSYRSTGTADPSNRGYSVSFIGGTALSPTQITNLNTSINTFNTTLSR